MQMQVLYANALSLLHVHSVFLPFYSYVSSQSDYRGLVCHAHESQLHVSYPQLVHVLKACPGATDNIGRLYKEQNTYLCSKVVMEMMKVERQAAWKLHYDRCD